MKKLKQANESHLAQFCETGDSRTLRLKRNFVDQEGNGSAGSSCGAGTQSSAIIADASEEKCEEILKFLRLIRKGMEDDGNWVNIMWVKWTGLRAIVS